MKIGHSESPNATPALAASANASASLGSDASGSNFAALLQRHVPAAVAAPAPPMLTPAPQAPQSRPPAREQGDSSNSNAAAGSAESSETSDEVAQEDAAAQTRQMTRPRMRSGSGADAAGRVSRDPRAPGTAKTERDEAAAHDRSTPDAATASTRDTATPSDNAALPNWLAGLLPPTAVASQAGDAAASAGTASGTSGDDVGGSDTTDATQAGAGRGRGLAHAGSRKTDARELLANAGPESAASTAAKDGAAATPATSNFSTLLAGQRHDEISVPRRDASGPRTDAPYSSVSALSAAANSATTAVAGGAPQDAGSTTAAHVHAAVGSPEFPQELGVQLSVLARDGVQQAELHLNPAEMGPVSVQIVMDGTQARIDFGADVAATRQAIEAGLPELASALRDAGFTLAGGGVSQHAGGRQGADGDASRRDGSNGTRRIGRVADDASGTATRVLRARVSAGGVDLYA